MYHTCWKSETPVIENFETEVRKQLVADSIRSLPLIQPVEDMLLRMKKEQVRYQYLCGDSNNQDFLEYVYVNEIGERVKPAYITDHFKTYVIRKNKCQKK